MNCNDLDKRTKAYKQCIENQSEGLGDKIEKVFEATGIKKVVKKIFEQKLSPTLFHLAEIAHLIEFFEHNVGLLLITINFSKTF